MVALDWIWSAMAAALVAGGLTLLAWALLWDRSRGRRRCPRCWYDMAGAAGLVCPECGRVARDDRALHATRRRWRWTAPALLLVMVGAAALSASRLGWDFWGGVLPRWSWAYLMPLAERGAVAQIETAGLLPSRTDPSRFRADLILAQRITLVLDGTADPALAPPPAIWRTMLRAPQLSVSGDPTVRWRSTGLQLAGLVAVTPKDQHTEHALALALDIPEMRHLLMPSIERLVRDPSESNRSRRHALRAIEVLEGSETSHRLAVELVRADANDPLSQMLLLEALQEQPLTPEQTVELLTTAVETADGNCLRMVADGLAVRAESAAVAVPALRRASLRATDRLAQRAATAALDRIQRRDP